MENIQSHPEKCCRIPQRWVLGIMGFWCFAVSFSLRICLNIAITQMVKDHTNNSTHAKHTTYPQYSWDEKLQGIILGSFYYGYVFTQIPGGLIVEKYGAKYTAGIGILLTSVFTIATPILIKIGGANLLIVLRVLEGLGEGPSFPAVTALMSRWVPQDERGMLGSLIFSGTQIGNILGLSLSGFIMSEDGNWPLVFYVFGTFGIVWFLLWIILISNDPDSHPFITQSEKDYLKEKIAKKTNKSIPWKPFLTSLPIWAIIISGIGHEWGTTTISSDLPKYMSEVLNFNIKNTGMLSTLPYLIMWITSFIFGTISDMCIRKKYISVRNSRKLYTTIATIGPGIFIVGAGYVGCDTKLSVTMFTIAMGLMGAYYCGTKVNVQDITPNYAGIAAAFTNGLASISGIVTPYIVAIVAPNKTLEQWQTVFWIVFSVLSASNIFYTIFAQGETQPWNNTEKDSDSEDRKNNKE